MKESKLIQVISTPEGKIEAIFASREKEMVTISRQRILFFGLFAEEENNESRPLLLTDQNTLRDATLEGNFIGIDIDRTIPDSEWGIKARGHYKKGSYNTREPLKVI